MTVAEQVRTLVDVGVADLANLTPSALAQLAERLPDESDAVVAVHPSLVPARGLVTLLRRHDKPGFVVADMTDLEDFAPIGGVELPDNPLDLVHDVDRGDDMRNQPKMLEPNYCFMTIGSRKLKGNDLDTRTPAIWISGGTGRDGKANLGAPKVGWCWADNRHTWLGFAHARTRSL